MKDRFEIEYNNKQDTKISISTRDDMYGNRTLSLPSELAIKIFEALTKLGK